MSNYTRPLVSFKYHVLTLQHLAIIKLLDKDLKSLINENTYNSLSSYFKSLIVNKETDIIRSEYFKYENIHTTSLQFLKVDDICQKYHISHLIDICYCVILHYLIVKLCNIYIVDENWIPCSCYRTLNMDDKEYHTTLNLRKMIDIGIYLFNPRILYMIYYSCCNKCYEKNSSVFIQY